MSRAEAEVHSGCNPLAPLERRFAVRLGDVAEIVMGQSPPGDAVNPDGGVPLLNGPTEFGEHNPIPLQYTTEPKRIAEVGDILFCVRGSTTGRMNWADQEYAIGRGIAAIRHSTNASLQPFVRAVIETRLPTLLKQATGSTFPNVSRHHLTHIPYPPLHLDEQRKIAEVLGALNARIELNRCMCETLEEMAQSLYKAWFVDFEPVRAKMEGRWCEGESLPGFPAEIYHLFPDELADSQLGLIPAGSRPAALGDVIDIHDFRRVPLSKPERQRRKGPFRYYGAAGIVDYVDDFLFDGRFILVGEDGSVVSDDGGPMVQYVWGQFWVNNHAHVLSGANGVSTEHLWLILNNISIRPFVTGAVQPKLNQRNLKSIPVLVPSRQTVRAFERVIAPLLALLRQAQDESRLLEHARATFLPKLISGELRVSVSAAGQN